MNTDAVHSGADQFFQWLAVDPTDGTADVLFYDRREDLQNRTQIVVLGRSTDGGRSFQNYAWISEPFEAGGVFFGDYTGIAASGGRVYGIWTEKPAIVPQTGNDTGDKSDEVKSRSRGTVVKVGIADFKTAASGTSQ